MFDAFTRDDLYELHTRLAATATRIHSRVMASRVFSDEWQIASAAHNEVTETMSAVTGELTRRHMEASNT
jgi:hypothetical protein